MYRVIKAFTDLTDNKFPYSVGDIYPRKGLKVSKARVEELATANNRQHKPLIKEVKESK